MYRGANSIFRTAGTNIYLKLNTSHRINTKYMEEYEVICNIVVRAMAKRKPQKKIKKPVVIIIEADIHVDDSAASNANVNLCVDMLCKNNGTIDTAFKKCVAGYHLINPSPINETIWEDINIMIFSSLNIDIHYKSNGSHSSGMDIHCSFGKISNKSAKYANNKQSVKISSYRLTTVCDQKKHGTPSEIIAEINKRKNFDYYSMILRQEESANKISYDWLLIPSNYAPFNPASYTWSPAIGKQGKKKNTQIGWTTNEINGCSMSITFSMSSQLWMTIAITDDIKKFIIASATVTCQPKYNYIDLFDKL